MYPLPNKITFTLFKNPANSTEGIINASYSLTPFTGFTGLLLLRTYCILPQRCGVIPTWNPPFYVSLTVHLDIIFVNNQLDAQIFFMYVYFYSLHVSNAHVLIIRRINCINMTSGICHSENKWNKIYTFVILDHSLTHSENKWMV